MVVLEIEDIKKFMSALLIEELFDRLLLIRAQIKMAVSFDIDGTKNMSFFDTAELEEAQDREEFEAWSTVRPVVLSIVKGKKLPTRMSVMLKKKDSGDGISYSINILYENSSLKVITNVSQKGFSLERPDSSGWDEYVEQIISKQQISYVRI